MKNLEQRLAWPIAVVLACAPSLAAAGEWSAAPIPPTAPAPLTPAEEAVLAVGQVVVRKEDGHFLRAIGRVDADPDRVLAAVCDLSNRQGGPVKQVVITDQRDHDRKAQFKAGALGLEVKFHVVLQCAADTAYCELTLDPTQENGLNGLFYTYQVLPDGKGSRLDYRVDISHGPPLPQFVKGALFSSRVRDEILRIAERATASGAPATDP